MSFVGVLILVMTWLSPQNLWATTEKTGRGPRQAVHLCRDALVAPKVEVAAKTEVAAEVAATEVAAKAVGVVDSVESNPSSPQSSTPSLTPLEVAQLWSAKLPQPNTEIDSFLSINRLSKTPAGQDPADADFYLLRKISFTWRSGQGASFFAVESDPTWPISALGPELSYFFGIALQNESELKVPLPHILEQRIALMNQALVDLNYEPIPLHVYEQKPAARQNAAGPYPSYAEKFVRDFIERKSFPFSIKELTHDISHHSLNLLLTEKQMAPLMARGRALIEFTDFLRSKALKKHLSQEALPIKLRERLIRFIYQMFSREIDNITGVVPILLLDYRASSKEWLLIQAREQVKPPNLFEKASRHFYKFLFGTTEDPELSEKQGFFRLFQLHLGEAMRRSHKVATRQIRPFTPHTVDEWLYRFVTERVFYFLTSSEETIKSNASAAFFINDLRKRGLWDSLIIYRHDLKSDLTTALDLYFKSHPWTHQTNLATYDQNFNVIDGLASNEPLVGSFERRIAEMKSALEHHHLLEKIESL